MAPGTHGPVHQDRPVLGLQPANHLVEQDGAMHVSTRFRFNPLPTINAERTRGCQAPRQTGTTATLPEPPRLSRPPSHRAHPPRHDLTEYHSSSGSAEKDDSLEPKEHDVHQPEEIYTASASLCSSRHSGIQSPMSSVARSIPIRTFSRKTRALGKPNSWSFASTVSRRSFPENAQRNEA